MHNPLVFEAHIDKGIIQEALISDPMYRGFEQILIGRPAMDMPYYTQRICGICSSAHAITSALAVEQALGMHVPPNGIILRNLILAGDFLQNHIRQLYLLAFPDYFRGPDLPPFLPHPTGDFRLSQEEDARLTEHYFASFEIARLAHAAFAVFGGKAPHGHGIVPGGVTMEVDADRVMRFRGYIKEVRKFIEDTLIPDLALIIERYPEYADLGKGNGNYAAVGGFPAPDGGTLWTAGVLINNRKGQFDEQKITEEVTTAWYKPTGALHPSAGETVPDRGQPQGYSWVKAPRYDALPIEVGPLARAKVAGAKTIGSGALARLWARAQEAKSLAETCLQWSEQLKPGAETLSSTVSQDSGTGVGLHEAMRGSLGHWIAVKNGRITHYQIVTPSAINFSSRDAAGTRSVGESSVLGLPAATPGLQEAGRVIRSFDPCFSCTVHLIDGDLVRSRLLPV